MRGGVGKSIGRGNGKGRSILGQGVVERGAMRERGGKVDFCCR